MAQELAGITQACEAFVVSIDEGRYYDAHEDLEVIWYPKRFEDDDEIRVWKGFINAAVSFELMARGRPNPSNTAWKTYCKYSPLIETLVAPHKELYVKIAKFIERKYTEVRKGE